MKVVIKNNDKQNQDLWKKHTQLGLSYLIFNLIGLWLFQQFTLSPLIIRETQIPYSKFKAKIQSGQIVSVTLGTDRHVGTIKNPNPQDGKAQDIPFTVTAMPNGDLTLIEALDKARVTPRRGVTGNPGWNGASLSCRLSRSGSAIC